MAINNYLTENINALIVDLSPMPVFVCAGKNMVVEFANHATLKAWGKDSSIIGLPFNKALPELIDQPFFNLLIQVYSTGIPYYTESDQVVFLVKGQRKTFYYKFSYQPLKDEAENVWGVLCIASDVSELSLANKRAEESERRFKNLISKAPVALCVLKGTDFVLDVANEKILEIWGKTEEQVIDKPIFDGLPEARGQGLESLLNNVYNTGVPFFANEMSVELPKNGQVETKILNFGYHPYYEIDGAITGIMAAAIDVTEQVISRRATEEINRQLKSTQHRLELALKAGRLGAYERNLTNGTRIFSDQFKTNFGYLPDATIDINVLMDSIHADYRTAIEEIQARCLVEDYPFNIEFPVYWPDHSLHWIVLSGESNTNEKGDRIISGVTQDVTEQKRLQHQREEFISIASHELKTPLTSLSGTLQILDRVIKKDMHSQPLIKQMATASIVHLKKVTNLVNDLLNSTKIEQGQFVLNKTWFTLSELIDNCCDHIRLEGAYQLKTEGDLELQVFADEHKLDQVLVNFVNNAVKYAAESKEIIIRIERNNNTAKLIVEDFGNGIPNDKVLHLFDRFYRADNSGAQYSGLGLGLYICQQIITAHNGEIGVESEVGKGSKFWFTVPIK